MSSASHHENGVDDDDRLEPSLSTLLDTDTLKWIFVGGKGGVGKTTTSCSLAVQLAKKRENVLILSTDPAHNLSDAFSQKFSNSPSLVNGFSNLFAMEIDSTLQKSMGFELNKDDGGWSKIIPELMTAFPGIDEALSFAELMNSVQTMQYSVIVFDTAPTGHTLRLLSFPDLLERGLAKLTGLREKMSGALNMMNTMTGNTVNEEEIHNKLDSLKAVTSSVRKSFQDASRTTFVCVCIPEFLSVYETERLVQELAKHGIDSSNIVVNQVLFPLAEAESINVDVSLLDSPNTDKDSDIYKAFKLACRKISLLEKSYLGRRKMQSKYLKQIYELYSEDFHVVPIPLQSEEVRGISKLEVFGTLLCEPRELPIVSK